MKIRKTKKLLKRLAENHSDIFIHIGYRGSDYHKAVVYDDDIMRVHKTYVTTSFPYYCVPFKDISYIRIKRVIL